MRDGTVAHRLLEEIEIGLPYRLQLDLEVRGALFDWGRLWGNPVKPPPRKSRHAGAEISGPRSPERCGGRQHWRLPDGGPALS